MKPNPAPLEGRELDEAVAKARGWKRMTWEESDPVHQAGRNYHTSYWHDASGKQTERAEESDDFYYPEGAYSPSSFLLDAWQLVEEMTRNTKQGVNVRQTSSTATCVVPLSLFEDIIGNGESAPEAISRAYLEFMGRKGR